VHPNKEKWKKRTLLTWERWQKHVRKPKNENPLPFLRNSSSKFPFGSGCATQQARKRAVGPMDKIFQK
jgi:hypothetical protein